MDWTLKSFTSDLNGSGESPRGPGREDGSLESHEGGRGSDPSEEVRIKSVL